MANGEDPVARIDIIGFDPGPITGSTGYVVLTRAIGPKGKTRPDWRRIPGGSGVIQATPHNLRMLALELDELLVGDQLNEGVMHPLVDAIAIEGPHPGKGQSFLGVSETVGLLRAFYPEVEHVVLTAAEARAAICGSRKAKKTDVRFVIEQTVSGWLTGRTAHESDAAAVARVVGDRIFFDQLSRPPLHVNCPCGIMEDK